MREWKFESSSSPKIYTTQINETSGLLSCDCPGWTVKKQGKVRECKHTKLVIAEQKLSITVRDEQQFVGEGDNYETPMPVITTHSTPTFPPESSEELKLGGGFIKPMLASAMPEGKSADSFGDDWVMEEKFDGHRLIVRVLENHNILAWSRLATFRTLPSQIDSDMAHMPSGVYDGEILIPGMHSYDVVAGINSGREVLVLFDMLEVLGESVMAQSYSQRRAFLEQAYRAIDNDESPVQIAAQWTPSMAEVATIWAHGGEGAILKRREARYRPGWRSPDWIKVKQESHVSMTLVGYKEGKNGPYSTVVLRDSAGVETAVKTLDNKTMRELAADPEGHIGKRLVVQYHERTRDGNYRHPMWDHWAAEHE